jgi:hypothetical protein
MIIASTEDIRAPGTSFSLGGSGIPPASRVLCSPARLRLRLEPYRSRREFNESIEILLALFVLAALVWIVVFELREGHWHAGQAI